MGRSNPVRVNMTGLGVVTRHSPRHGRDRPGHLYRHVAAIDGRVDPRNKSGDGHDARARVLRRSHRRFPAHGNRGGLQP